MTATPPFQKFSAAVCRDQLAEKLRRALKPVTFDGSECHRVINSELQGVENEITASNLRHATTSQYHDTVPVDAVIEVVGKWLESESPFERAPQFTHARE
jgi:hypothetical protein